MSGNYVFGTAGNELCCRRRESTEKDHYENEIKARVFRFQIKHQVKNVIQKFEMIVLSVHHFLHPLLNNLFAPLN